VDLGKGALHESCSHRLLDSLAEAGLSAR
jgi:hypothetical protein